MTIEADMVLMAAGSYWDVRQGTLNTTTGIDTDNDAPTPAGWNVLTQFDKSGSGPNAVTGFSARVYQNISTGDIVISYGGTEFKVNGYLPTAGLVADFVSGNIPLAVGNASAQALAAAKLYQEVKADATFSNNISFTGHSLGGGLASVMAVWFDRPAHVFAAAPFQLSADSNQSTTLPDLFSLNRALPNVRFQLGSSADPALLSYNPATDFATRETNVKAYAIKGELLETYFGRLKWIEGSTQPLFTNNAITLSAGDKHSIDLHASALLSPTFETAAGKLPTALARLMDGSLYGGDVLGNQQLIITKLIRNEVGVRSDDGTQVLLAANGMLTHFANDLGKLGTNISGLNKAAQDAIIAQGIEWYYWQGTNYAGQEFFTQTGESLQYTIALGTDLVGAQNKAADYAGKWLTPIVKDHGEIYSVSFARDYDQWNIATGTADVSLTSLKSDKSQIFIGAGGGDTFTGGDLDDVMFAGAGADTLNGGGGNDELYGGAENDTLNGGAGYDIYHIEGNDIIEDSNGVGIIKDKKGNRITGAIEKRSDGSYSFLGDTSISVTGGTDLTLALADGSRVTIKNFKDGDLGLNLNDTAATPETNRTILGDLAPMDFDSATAGVQTRRDDLDNVITDPRQPALDRPDMLFDSAGNDLIRGGGGLDFIDAWRGGNDKLDGGAGNDFVMGRGGDDIVIGGEGSDLLRGDAGQDKLYAGTEATLEAALAAQDATASGLKGDFIDGSEDADVVVGDTGHDALNGGQGDDIILGGAGDDTIRGDLETSSISMDWSISRSVTTDANGVTLYSAFYNQVSFSAPVGGGDDTIFAGAGVDWVMAEDGDDYIDGGLGDDVLFGESGRDEIFGGSGNDRLIGDSVSIPLAEHGDDYLDGEEGDDILNGGGGDDLLFGGAGNDQLYDDDGEDYLDGEEGDDILIGGAEGDILYGGEGADQIAGDNGGTDSSGAADLIYGGAGNDFIDGQGENDVIDAGADNDLVAGGTGNDQIDGGLGDDQLQGGDGNDTLAGGDGSDVLFGESGNDTLQGSAGTDYLLGGLGDDSLDGGEGDDVYYYTRGEGNDRISDSGGTDWLVFNDINWGQVQLGIGSMKLTIPDGEIHLDDFDADNPYAAGGIEYFQFADGTVMSKTQLINAIGFTPTGTPQADVLSGTALSDTIRALAGDDVVTARGGNDLVYANDGADVVSAGEGNDLVYGGMGNDVLLGEGGNDTLYGEAGNDLLAGGADNDLLMGGDGNDNYLFQAGDGQDTVTDTLGQNAIALGSGLTLEAVTFARQGNDLFIAIKNTTDRLTIKDWFAVDSHFASVVLGDGRVLDRAGVDAAMPTNQAPLTTADSVTVVEDGLLTVSGNALANDSDPEGRALHITNSGNYAGTVGALTLNSNGAYNYSLANESVAVQSLAAGQSLTERFAYRVTDDDPNGATSSESAIVVTVLGSNDLPVLGTDSVSTEEDVGSITGNVLANDRDVDAGTTLTVTSAGTRTGFYGALLLDGDGAWNYSLANASTAVQNLAAGQTVTERFAFNVSDGQAQVGGALSIAITGQNDAPILVTALADQSAAANTSWTWQLPADSFSDVDAGDMLTYGATLANGTALPSWLSFDAATQTFSGRVPKSATGSVDIRVSATDRMGINAADAFTLNFASGTGGAGNSGGGSTGNEGVGNGVDGPPPGHDTSFNDGAGSGPGNPGAQGGNGYRPLRREDIVMAKIQITSSMLEAQGAIASHGNASDAHAAAPGQVKALAVDNLGDMGVAIAPTDAGQAVNASVRNDTATAMGQAKTDDQTAAGQTPWLTNAAWASLGDLGAVGSDGHGVAVFARWLAVEQALARESASAGLLPAWLDATKGANLSDLLTTNGGLPDAYQSLGVDTLGLRVGAGLQVFKGLGNGVQAIM